MGTETVPVATTSTSTLPIARGALPSCILFEENDGIYWLRGTDLERAKTLLGLRCDGKAVGFDRMTWLIHVEDLVKRRIAVAIRQGNWVRTVHLQRTTNLRPLRSTPINLAPVLLFGVAGLERLERRLARKDSRLRPMADRISDELANGRLAALADFGDVYVYQVAEDMYEVDWELTTMPPSTVELLAVAAYRTGYALPCRLVPPRPRRGHDRARLPSAVEIAEPVPYGQLRLPF